MYSKGDYPLLLHPHSEPIAFGNYFFEYPHNSFAFSRGIFVVAGNPELPRLVSTRDSPPLEYQMRPMSSFAYPDGRTAYRVFYKAEGWSCSPRTSISLKSSSDVTICSVSATTPTTGGPWRAVVTWNAVVRNPGSEFGSIKCEFSDDSSNRLTAHTWLPINEDRYWNETLLQSSAAGAYGNNVRTTWSWRCDAQPSAATVLSGSRPHGNSYAQVYFVPALENNYGTLKGSVPRR